MKEKLQSSGPKEEQGEVQGVDVSKPLITIAAKEFVRDPSKFAKLSEAIDRTVELVLAAIEGDKSTP